MSNSIMIKPLMITNGKRIEVESGSGIVPILGKTPKSQEWDDRNGTERHETAYFPVPRSYRLREQAIRRPAYTLPGARHP